MVAYTDDMRMLLRIPRLSSASKMFADVNIPACQAVVRYLNFEFSQRIDSSENMIVKMLVKPLLSSTRFTSDLWKFWFSSLLLQSEEVV